MTVRMTGNRGAWEAILNIIVLMGFAGPSGAADSPESRNQDASPSFEAETVQAIAEASARVTKLGIDLTDRNWVIRERAAKELVSLGLLARPHVARLVAMTRDEESAVRDSATATLANMGVVAIPILERRLKECRSGEIAWSVGYSELRQEGQPLVAMLRGRLRDGVKRVRSLPDKKQSVSSQEELGAIKNDIRQICEVLANMGSSASAATPEIITLLSASDSDGNTIGVNQWDAVRAVGDVSAVAFLDRIADDKVDSRRELAARAALFLRERLGAVNDVRGVIVDRILNARLGERDAMPDLLLPLLKHSDKRVIQFALSWLGRTSANYRQCAREIGSLLNHADPEVCGMALRALEGGHVYALDAMPQLEVAWRKAASDNAVPLRRAIEKVVRALHGRT